MKTKLTAFVLASITAFMLSACQATPENAAIVGKDTERLVEQAQDNTTGVARKNLELPENEYIFSTTGADGALTVNVNAAVNAPECGLPMADVSEAGFSQEMVKGFVSYLFSDEKPMTRATNQTATKSELEEQILMLKKQLADQSYDTQEFTDADIQARIDALQEQYDSAPETNDASDAVQTDGTMELTDRRGDSAYTLDASSSDSSIFVLSYAAPATSQSDSMMSYFGPKGYDYSEAGAICYENGAIPEAAKGKLTISFGDAKAFADGFLAAGGVTDMALGNTCVVNDAKTGNVDGEVTSAENYAWQFSYVRVVNGVNVILDGTAGGTGGDMLPWSYEGLSIVVDNDGIQKIEWFAPTATGELLTEDAGLLTFPDVIDVFENMILAQYEPKAKVDNNGVLSAAGVDITIDHIELGLIRIREQNANGRDGIYTPAWVFYGQVRQSQTYAEDASTFISYNGGSDNPSDEKYAVLVINAIDGSVIDTGNGY